MIAKSNLVMISFCAKPNPINSSFFVRLVCSDETCERLRSSKNFSAHFLVD